MDPFVIAENPDPESSLPYLVRLPIEGGIVLKTRESWPRSNRSYCHPAEEWPAGATIIEEVPVQMCRRRGSAIDLILDRRTNYRSQFVFTTKPRAGHDLLADGQGHEEGAPGSAGAQAASLGDEGWTMLIDSREKYPYRFADRPVATERQALSAGDYAVGIEDRLVADLERKTLENLSADLVSGKLGFVMAELSTLPAAAVVVEDRYTSLFKADHVEPGWLPELVARLQVRHPQVPIVFCDNRKFAEEWTYRFLGAALAALGSDEAGSG